MSEIRTAAHRSSVDRAVHDVKVKVGRVGVPGVSQPADHLSLRDVFTDVN
jgi:hypothetical protein